MKIKMKIGEIQFLGNHHKAIRINGGRVALGIGHTNDEAWRNACDLCAERNPILEGAMAVLRTMPPVEKRATRTKPSKMDVLRMLVREISAVALCMACMSPVIVAAAAMLGGA